MAPASSFDDEQLRLLFAATSAVQLDFVVIGNASAALQGAPLMTQDVDLFMRDTKRNRTKIQEIAQRLDASCEQPFLPTSETFRLVARYLIVDCVFQLSSHQRFESVKSRAVETKIGGRPVRLATLEDIIIQKKAAGRLKDKAVMPILEASLAVKRGLESK